MKNIFHHFWTAIIEANQKDFFGRWEPDFNDLFSFANKSEIYNYTDNNTLYSANQNISQIISDLSNDFETLTKWFYDN